MKLEGSVTTEKVLNISQARPVFSDMVKDAVNKPFFIGSRGVPVAMIVDYKKGMEYLPKRYLQAIEPKVAKKTAGQLFMEKVEEWEKMSGPYKGRKVNISENHDKYIYK